MSGRHPEPRSFRLLVHGPEDGAFNMAIDEAILCRYAAPGGPEQPTLRVYAWDRPALSLGRGQSARLSHSSDFLRREGIDLVRRPTGGRAVLHEHERTYAVVGNLRKDPFPGGVVDTYRRIARALVRGLAALGIDARREDDAVVPPVRPGDGPAICFDRPSVHEITVGGRKIAGSAQLRRGGAFLQHGSLLLRVDADRLARATGSPVPQGVVAVEEILGRVPDANEVDRALVQGFEAAFGMQLEPGELDPAELSHATELRAWKYESAEWTLHGRMGARERRWGPSRPPLQRRST